MRTMKIFILTLLAALAVLFCVQGLVGENNQGFLEFRGGKKPQADVIQAENKDRAAVYKAIAERQKTTPEFVGQARAAQIAEKEPSGFWVQEPDGKWKKK